MDANDKQTENKQYQREVRCPIHSKLIGKYDARDGLINATFYCPLCHREYTYTVKRYDK